MLLAALFTYAAGPSQAQTSVSGTVTLQGWLGAPQPLTFTFQTTDAATAFTRSLTPAPDGTFTLSGIPAGRYNLFIKGAKWLQKSVPADTTAGDAAGLSAALPPGDIDGDNQVTLADYLILSAAYNSAPDRGNWNPAADLNGDGRVSLADYLLLSAQYNKAGDFPLPPAAPTGLSATPAEGAVVLAWDSSPSALAYNVYRSTVSGSGYVKVNAAPVTGAGYTDTGLTDGTTYYYVVTATVSYSESAYSGEVSATPNLPAPTDLAAYATGSGKITLYWSGVPGATGYNVYRGTAAGFEDYNSPVNGNTPVTTQDTGPGVANLFMFSDTGLTDGTEYFYTVEAVSGAAQSGPSNEDSDAPDPTAIPWDSGDPATITSLIRQNESDETGLNFSLGYCSLRVMGPDGVIYQEGISNALPPDGSIDPVNGTMTLGNIVSPIGHFLQEASSSSSEEPSSNMIAPPAVPTLVAPDLLYGGGMRRVTSKLTGSNGAAFTGVSGTVYLPSTADSSYMSIATNSALGSREGPNAYVGMTGDGVEADAGIQFVPNTYPAGANLPNRWEGYLRIADGPINTTTSIDNRFRVMGDQYNYIDADSQIGNGADLKFTVNRHDATCGLVIFGYDYGVYYAKWYVGATTSAKLNHLQHHPVQMKREFSLDQDIHKGIGYAPFTNAIHSLIVHPDGTRETKSTAGYVTTGSYMDYIGWQNGSLYQNNSQLDWTSDLVAETYYSVSGGSNAVVSLSPPSGDAQNETVSIKHF